MIFGCLLGLGQYKRKLEGVLQLGLLGSELSWPLPRRDTHIFYMYRNNDQKEATAPKTTIKLKLIGCKARHTGCHENTT